MSPLAVLWLIFLTMAMAQSGLQRIRAALAFVHGPVHPSDAKRRHAKPAMLWTRGRGPEQPLAVQALRVAWPRLSGQHQHVKGASRRATQKQIERTLAPGHAGSA
jgi:hypothetical protein